MEFLNFNSIYTPVSVNCLCMADNVSYLYIADFRRLTNRNHTKHKHIQTHA